MASDSARLSSRPMGLVDEPHGARVNLRQTLEIALEQMPGLFDKVIDGLSGTGDKPIKGGIGMAAVKANFPPHVQAVVQLIMGQRQQVVASFTKRLRYYVYLGVGTATQAPQMMRFEDLKLFEEHDLDESIEVASALQEISISTDPAMREINALVSSLLGWITVQPLINPLRPEMFARALRDCISEQVADVEIRGAIISHMAARLGVLLRKLYAELCQWLKSYGVEEASSMPTQTLPGVAKAAATSSVSSSVARTLLTLDKLRRLLSGELDGEARQAQDFLHTVPASVVALQDMRQVEAMLQRLEKKAQTASSDPNSAEAQERRKTQERMASKDGRELGKQLGEEVVRLMLDNLIADERLLPRVRGHLQRLEPLLMTIAQEDGRFFSDKQHAARQYLDSVTNRCLGFASEREEGYAAFVESVEKSIALLHRKTSAGEAVQLAFGDVMERLSAVWERLDKQDKLRREEAAKALLHAEQRNTIAQYVAQEFRDQAQSLDVPPTVVDFVCGPWAHAVAESQLRCTDGRTDPQGYQSLVSELFWSVQPSKAKRNRKRLVQLIPGMLAKLRQGLALIEFPPERISDFFANLIELHEAALEGERPKAEFAGGLPSDAQLQVQRSDLEALYAQSSGHDASAFMNTEEAQASAFDDFPSSRLEEPEPPTAKDQVWLAESEAQGAGFVNEQAMLPVDVSAPAIHTSERIAISPEVTMTIPIGSWVELMLDGAWLRAQLTWASPMRSLFMFVSRGGKAHSMSKRTMDKLCAQGMIRLVSDGHLVDKALDAVAQAALQNSVDVNRSGH